MSTKKFTKIDKRNTAYSYFDFYCECGLDISIGQRPSFQKFFLIREWCWNTWGSSKELHNWIDDQNALKYNPSMFILHSQNEHWSWGNENYKPRIYLRTEKELSLYLLKWQ